MKFALNKVSRLPDACYSVWRLSGGQTVEHPLALADYKALGQPGAGAPANPTGDPGAVWLSARSEAKYDTVSGKLAAGDVCDWSHGPDYCNVPSDVTMVIGTPEGESDLAVKAEDIISGTKEQVSALTINTRRAGITVVNGEMEIV